MHLAEYPGKRGPKRRSLAERFWEKVDVRDGDDCWLWTASTTGPGYGQIGAGGKYGGMLLAHRVSYEINVGPIPERHEIHHTCLQRTCVNPAHLEAHLPEDHPDAGPALNRAKTHCIHGHPFDEANTYIECDGRRSCRACRRIGKRARYHAKRAQKNAR